MINKILVIGASGTGTTTIGKLLSKAINVKHTDLDDIFWIPTEIPFTKFRTNTEIKKIIEKELMPLNGWIISGDPSNWEVDHVMRNLHLVVFLSVPTEIRVKRINEREIRRFGADILDGGRFHEVHQKFIAWTEKYDTGGVNGRTRHKQEEWLKTLETPVLRLEGDLDKLEIIERIIAFIDTQ